MYQYTWGKTIPDIKVKKKTLVWKLRFYEWIQQVNLSKGQNQKIYRIHGESLRLVLNDHHQSTLCGMIYTLNEKPTHQQCIDRLLIKVYRFVNAYSSNVMSDVSQSGFTRSELTIVTIEKGVKYVYNKDTRTTSLALFWHLYCHLWTCFTPCSSVSIVNFEHLSAGWSFPFATECL